jgi:MoxR-like ATPase
MATQNPIEYEGTFPLPEAQLDRFMLKLNMGYPQMEEEVEMLGRVQMGHPVSRISEVLSLEELIQCQQEVKQVYVDDSIKHYIVALTHATREHDQVYLGASPRGSIALLHAAQAYAYIRGRDYVLPDDVKYLAPFTLGHRIILVPDARLNGVQAERVVKEVLERIPVPGLDVSGTPKV